MCMFLDCSTKWIFSSWMQSNYYSNQFFILLKFNNKLKDPVKFSYIVLINFIVMPPSFLPSLWTVFCCSFKTIFGYFSMKHNPSNFWKKYHLYAFFIFEKVALRVWEGDNFKGSIHKFKLLKMMMMMNLCKNLLKLFHSDSDELDFERFPINIIFCSYW